MATMDIFRADPFRAISMTRAIERVGYIPGMLGSLPGVFETPERVRTRDVYIEERGTEPALIRFDNRGEPPQQRGGENGRTVRAFRTQRMSQSDRLTSDEISDIRAFGTESELQMVQQELARKQALMRRDMELSFEQRRLGCVQGMMVDADGSTVIDWADEFGQAIPTELDFNLDAASPTPGEVRQKCATIVRSMLTALKGLGGNQVMIYGLAGDTFFDQLVAHEELRETYKYTQAAATLREGTAWETLRYGGITFINYRGTDDGSSVAIPTDKCKFFPANAGIFQPVFAPAETFDFVNTPGQELYAWLVPDRDRNAFVDIEMYSYPLWVCRQPSALHRARNT